MYALIWDNRRRRVEVMARIEYFNIVHYSTVSRFHYKHFCIRISLLALNVHTFPRFQNTLQQTIAQKMAIYRFLN